MSLWSLNPLTTSSTNPSARNRVTATNSEVEWSIAEACGQSCSQEKSCVLFVSSWIQQISDSFRDASGTVGMDFVILVALAVAYGM